MNDAHYLTKQGAAKLKQEIEEIAEKQKKNSARLKEAIEQGDLSENAEYSDAKDQQAFLAGRLIEVKQILRHMVIIEDKKNKKGEIEIGSTIEIESKEFKKKFKIVGAEEANPSEGLISHESPLGSSFLGHKKGDKVEVTTPAGIMSYKIRSVE